MNTDGYSEVGVLKPWIGAAKNDSLDYTIDWSDWLAKEGVTIASATFAGVGITVEASLISGGKTVIWCTDATAGSYVTCRITTTGTPARIKEQTIYFRVGGASHEN